MQLRSFVSIAVSFGLASHAFAQQQEKGQSSSGELSYELRSVDKRESKSVWIWAGPAKTEAVKLCDTPAWGNLKVYFAPNDQWIVLQDGGASLGIALRLFKRAGGAIFQEVTETDINDHVEHHALEQAGLPPKEITDHRYVYCLGWSNDSKFLLIELSGKGRLGDDQASFNWFGVYDLEKAEFSADLNRFNASGVKREKLSR